MCSTSREAFELAQEFCKAFELKENIAKAKAERSQRDSKPLTSNSNNERRQVTQINYGKHEDTVKELEQQEKEETRIRKQLEAANRPPNQGCSHDHQKECASTGRPRSPTKSQVFVLNLGTRLLSVLWWLCCQLIPGTLVACRASSVPHVTAQGNAVWNHNSAPLLQLQHGQHG